MYGWLERWRNRQRELAAGTDASLVQANRRRLRVAFGLIRLALVLGLLDARLHLPHALHVVLGAPLRSRLTPCSDTRHAADRRQQSKW
jgi:hypothetical protein